ncbi:hypothetical protein [Saccharopolyspora dendranthemae]|uniref:hypothetical protein n=1 Tax=Saccharopolyspora dendranthemae TaxID=1181886 RepID=UPI0016448D5B|nr:hypothetical protein [Saccharopolyspora dendranthemae]
MGLLSRSWGYLRGASVGMNTAGAHHQDALRIYLRRTGFSGAQIYGVQPVHGQRSEVRVGDASAYSALPS